MEKAFEVDGPVRLDVQLASGDIRVDVESEGSVEVELTARHPDAQELVDAARVELRGRELVVDVPSRASGLSIGSLFRDRGVTCRVRCPEGSSLRARTKSADVDVRGTLAGADVATASGDVRLAAVAGDLVVKSASGDVAAGDVTGKATTNTASGDIRLGRIGGSLGANSASGDVSVEAVGSDAKANTASGDISIEEVAHGETSVNSASGDVRIGIRRGSRAHLDCSSVSGDTRSELDVGDDEPQGEGPLLRIRARTVSGDIAVVRAPTPAATQEVRA